MKLLVRGRYSSSYSSHLLLFANFSEPQDSSSIKRGFTGLFLEFLSPLTHCFYKSGRGTTGNIPVIFTAGKVIYDFG